MVTGKIEPCTTESGMGLRLSRFNGYFRITSHGDQFTLSTRFIKPISFVQLLHRHSTTVSLETIAFTTFTSHLFCTWYLSRGEESREIKVSVKNLKENNFSRLNKRVILAEQQPEAIIGEEDGFQNFNQEESPQLRIRKNLVNHQRPHSERGSLRLDRGTALFLSEKDSSYQKK